MRALVAMSLAVTLAACGQLLSLDEFHGDAGAGASSATSAGGTGDAGGGSGSGGAKACGGPSDCEANHECMSSSCESGVCVDAPRTTDTPCGDGGKCDGQGTCADGALGQVDLYAGGKALAVAAIKGGMVVVGQFETSIEFGVHGLVTGDDPSTPHSDGFVARIGADGTVLWATQIGFKNTGEGVHAVVVGEDEGLVYVGGHCTADLYVNGVSLGDCGYTETIEHDGAFVVGLTANDGQLSAEFKPWFKKTNGLGDEVRGLALDSQGGLLVAGTEANEAVGTSPFAARLARKTGTQLSSLSLPATVAVVRGLAVSGDRLFVTGAFSGDFVVGRSSKLSAVGAKDLFVVKLAVEDGTLVPQVGFSIGTAGDDWGYALAVANDGRVAVGGAVQGPLSNPALPLPNLASEQGVVVMLEPETLTMSDVAAIGIAEGATAGVRALAFDAKDNLVVTGWADGTVVTVDAGIVSPPGRSSGFLAKYAENGALLYRHLFVGGNDATGPTAGRGLAVSLDDGRDEQLTHLVGHAYPPLSYGGVQPGPSVAKGTHVLVATLDP